MIEFCKSLHLWPLLRRVAATGLLLFPLSTSAAESPLSAIIDEHWQWMLEQYPERRLE